MYYFWSELYKVIILCSCDLYVTICCWILLWQSTVCYYLLSYWDGKVHENWVRVWDSALDRKARSICQVCWVTFVLFPNFDRNRILTRNPGRKNSSQSLYCIGILVGIPDLYSGRIFLANSNSSVSNKSTVWPFSSCTNVHNDMYTATCGGCGETWQIEVVLASGA